MFKFEFDIDDAEDIDGLEHLEITPPNTIQHPSQEALEPFAEISLTQLVRAQQSLPPRNVQTLTLAFFPSNKIPSWMPFHA